jgi:hypothetical protein
MGSLFKTPKPPKPPKIEDPEVARREAANLAAEELRKRKRGGRGSTILTGALGPGGGSIKKTLLGQ